MAYHYLEIVIHRVHPMCNPPMCNIVPNMQHFFEEFVFCPVFPMCNSQKNFNSKMTKMNGNRLTMVFKMIELTSKAVFYHLYQNILPLFTINRPLFFKMDKKSLFFIKNFIPIFSGRNLVTNFERLEICHLVTKQFSKNFSWVYLTALDNDTK